MDTQQQDPVNDHPALVQVAVRVIGHQVRIVDADAVLGVVGKHEWSEAQVDTDDPSALIAAARTVVAIVDQVKVLICNPVPDFFEPGAYYAEDRPYAAPEATRLFQCQLVTCHPGTGEEVALGFGRMGLVDEICGSWNLAALTRDSWDTSWIKLADR